MWNEDGEWVEDDNPWQRHQKAKAKPFQPITLRTAGQSWRWEPWISEQQADELQRWFEQEAANG